MGSFLTEAASSLCFPLEGEVPSPARRWGCTCQTPLLYPIDLGQNPEATSPARGRKEPGSALVRGDTAFGFVAGARRVSPIGEDLYPIDLGQNPEATSPARGRKEPGSALVRGDTAWLPLRRLWHTPIGFVAGAPWPIPAEGERKKGGRMLR